MTSNAAHWEDVYKVKDYTKVGWYQETAQTSLSLIEKTNVKPDQSIVDVGCGASMLVDALIEKGFNQITLLDISEEALSLVKKRLGDKATIPHYMASDITKISFQDAAGFWLYDSWPIDVWHDRAVFHFLTKAQDRQNYMSLLAHSLKRNGKAIISTFLEGGATQCSGLDIVAYTKEKMALLLPKSLEIEHSETSLHIKPDGTHQDYIHFILGRKE